MVYESVWQMILILIQYQKVLMEQLREEAIIVEKDSNHCKEKIAIIVKIRYIITSASKLIAFKSTKPIRMFEHNL